VTIGEAIMKVEDLLKRDKSFEKALKRTEENLIKGKKRKYRITDPQPFTMRRKRGRR
jgi:hypothetical protein